MVRGVNIFMRRLIFLKKGLHELIELVPTVLSDEHTEHGLISVDTITSVKFSNFPKT